MQRLQNGKVTVSSASQLVSVLVNSKDLKALLVTIDSENLARGWSLEDNQTTFSYKIRLDARVTAATTDIKCRYLAVGAENGEVLVLNFQSGGLLYTLPH